MLEVGIGRISNRIGKLAILTIMLASFLLAGPMLAPSVRASGCPLAGGSNKVEGCVVSYNDGTPMSGLYVIIVDCGGFTLTDWTITDSNGYFSFTTTLANGSPCINPNNSYVVSVNGVTPITWVTGCYVPSPCPVLGQNAYDLTKGQWAGDASTDGNGYASMTIPLSPGQQVLVPAAALYSNTGLASLSYTMSSSQTHSTTVSVSIGGGTSVSGSYTTSVTTTFAQTFNNAPNYASYLAAPYWAIGFYCAGSTAEANGPGGGWTCSQGLQNVGTTIATGGQYTFVRTGEYLSPTSSQVVNGPHLDCTFTVPVQNTPWTWSYTQTGSTSTTFGVTSGVSFNGVSASLGYSESSTSEKSDTTTVSFTTNGWNLRFIMYPAGGTCPNPNANPTFGDELHVWDMSPPPDFSISSSPSSLSVNQGSTPTSWSRATTISVQGLNGYGSDTALTASSSDSNLILSLSPQSVNPLGGTATSTLTVNDPSASDYGSYNIYVNGQGGGRFHQVVIPLAITIPDFTVSGTSPPAAFSGTTATSTITVSPAGSFTSAVALTVTSTTAGLNCGLVNPGSVTPPGTATLSCYASSAGSYTATITGTSGSLSHPTNVIFTVTDFSLSSNFNNGPVNLNTGVPYQVTVSGVNGFSGSVNLSLYTQSCSSSCSDGSPPTATWTDTGTTATSVQLSTCPSYTCTKTLTITGYTMVGQFSLYLLATCSGCGSGAASHTMYDYFWVQCNPNAGTPPPSFCLWPQSNSVSVPQNAIPGDWMYLNSNAGYAGTVTLSTSISTCNYNCGSGTAPTVVWNDTRTTQTTSVLNPSAPSCTPGPVFYCAGRLLIIYAGTQTGDFTVTVIGICPASACTSSQTHSIQIDFYVFVSGGGGSVGSGTLITMADHSQLTAQNLKVGMQVLSYDMATHQYVTTTVTRYFSVVTNNQMEIDTSNGKPLIVDQNPAQKLYVQLPDGTISLISVTQLQVGYKLYYPLTNEWVAITALHYQNGGNHVMYDIYTSGPGNYIANGILDPLKM